MAEQEQREKSGEETREIKVKGKLAILEKLINPQRRLLVCEQRSLFPSDTTRDLSVIPST